MYIVDLANIGGLVMPVILEVHYDDNTVEEIRIPAEIWRYNNEKVSKLIMTEKVIESIILDPHLETADVDLDNNFYPPRVVPSRFKLFKQRERKNPMQNARDTEAGKFELEKEEGEEDSSSP